MTPRMCGGEECASELLQFPLVNIICNNCVGSGDAVKEVGEQSGMRVQDGDNGLVDVDELFGGKGGGIAANNRF